MPASPRQAPISLNNKQTGNQSSASSFASQRSSSVRLLAAHLHLADANTVPSWVKIGAYRRSRSARCLADGAIVHTNGSR